MCVKKVVIFEKFCHRRNAISSYVVINNILNEQISYKFNKELRENVKFIHKQRFLISKTYNFQ